MLLIKTLDLISFLVAQMTHRIAAERLHAPAM
jgi:hypothetical protein